MATSESRAAGSAVKSPGCCLSTSCGRSTCSEPRRRFGSIQIRSTPWPEDLDIPGSPVELKDNELAVTSPAVTTAELFHLPEPWPPSEAWPDE
jgi:hypothetical protein